VRDVVCPCAPYPPRASPPRDARYERAAYRADREQAEERKAVCGRNARTARVPPVHAMARRAESASARRERPSAPRRRERGERGVLASASEKPMPAMAPSDAKEQVKRVRLMRAVSTPLAHEFIFRRCYAFVAKMKDKPGCGLRARERRCPPAAAISPDAAPAPATHAAIAAVYRFISSVSRHSRCHHFHRPPFISPTTPTSSSSSFFTPLSPHRPRRRSRVDTAIHRRRYALSRRSAGAE